MAIRSKSELPTASHAVYLADTLGDLGLLYRLASAAFIGGTNDATEGHSPWEAANLQTAIIHGPRTANFMADYAALHDAGAAIQADTAETLAAALTQDLNPKIANAQSLITTYHAKVNKLAQDLVALT